MCSAVIITAYKPFVKHVLLENDVVFFFSGQKKGVDLGKRKNEFTCVSTGGLIMTAMVSSHAGLSCPTSWRCGSSSGIPLWE